jgi:hypothetical protein
VVEASPSVISASPTAVPDVSGWAGCGLESTATKPRCDPTGRNCDAAQSSDLEGDLLDVMIEDPYLFDEAVLTRDCPQFLGTWAKAKTGFGEGTHLVPGEVKPGRYQTLADKVTDCYWERSSGGRTVANDFLTGAARVTVTILKSDDAFTSRGCGNWIKA